jgi:S-methylmethionine-dependent homocysteine/selenocysteine methylase
MSRYRHALPQLGTKLFITEGGLETTLLFQHGIQLPEFAAYDLLRDEAGYRRLHDYYLSFLELARQHGVGMLLESPTWRANADWGEKIGDDAASLQALNRAGIELALALREAYDSERSPVVVSGQVGPRGDGYQADALMSADEAAAYHSMQIETFADAGADMVGALTMNYLDEAVGITRAAQAHGLPVCISFTVETDGRLPTGESLERAISTVDEATDGGPAYYQINCAHPTHFDTELGGEGAWLERIRGVRGNASRMSHEELDNSEELDEGNPDEFGQQNRALQERLPNLTVLGGCCGTDHRHIEQICLQVTAS